MITIHLEVFVDQKDGEELGKKVEKAIHMAVRTFCTVAGFGFVILGRVGVIEIPLKIT